MWSQRLPIFLNICNTNHKISNCSEGDARQSHSCSYLRSISRRTCARRGPPTLSPKSCIHARQINDTNTICLISQSISVVKKVAVIGAGPAGLAAAKALALEPAQISIDLFERRDGIGGVWLYKGDKSKVLPPVPSTDPYGSETLLPDGGFENRYTSAMYKFLETNLWDNLMEYSGVPSTPRTFNFIKRSDVLSYLERYFNTIPPANLGVHLNTNVVHVAKTTGDSQWEVTTENVTTLDRTVGKYDAVIVANGHYEFPFIPAVPGIKEWAQKDPSSVTHSKYFVSSGDFRDKNVLVIGNWASGMDLAIQIGTNAKKVYVSTKDDAIKPPEYAHIEQVRLISHYDMGTRVAHTIDGRVVENIDAIVFCTGFLYTFPFLKGFDPHITEGPYVKDLFRQIFNVKDPSLSFIGLPQFAAPLPLCESQASIVARVVTGRLVLPDENYRRQSYETELQEKGSSREFHSVKDRDFAYCNELFEWITASGADKEGLLPLSWDEKLISDRQNIGDVKKKRNENISKYAAQLRTEGREFEFPPL